METEIDFKKRVQEIKFTTEHNLTEEDFKRLIREKTERAKLYHRAVKQREDEFQSEHD